jgi:hypothetical protein
VSVRKIAYTNAYCKIRWLAFQKSALIQAVRHHPIIKALAHLSFKDLAEDYELVLTISILSPETGAVRYDLLLVDGIPLDLRTDTLKPTCTVHFDELSDLINRRLFIPTSCGAAASNPGFKTSPCRVHCLAGSPTS